MDPLNISLEGQENDIVDVPPDGTVTQRIYVTAPAGSKAADGGQIDVRMWVVDLAERTDRVHADTIFHGKGG